MGRYINGIRARLSLGSPEVVGLSCLAGVSCQV